MDRYEDFLKARRKILTEKLNAFLEGITEIKLGVGLVDIEDIIAEDEHDGLEFKSSLRWDTEAHTVNKTLEASVLKTIAAFNNGWGDGGKLIIGVDNDQNILGLEGDYSTLKYGSDRDAFEIHLRNLINQVWGVEFASNNVTISFEQIGESEICIVDINRGTKPLFVEMKDKGGQKAEKFFVRSGNSSPPISNPSEISEFIQSRFRSG